MKLIPLSSGESVKVDDDTYECFSRLGWYCNSGYAERKEKGKHILMHREIMKAKPGEFVDHINGDKLDNRRENLRLCNHSTNAMNMRKHRGASRFKGVSKHDKSWRTQIWKDSEKVFAACFPTEEAAALAYDLNAYALFGEYARLNFSGAIVGIYVDASASSPPSEDSHTV